MIFAIIAASNRIVIAAFFNNLKKKVSCRIDYIKEIKLKLELNSKKALKNNNYSLIFENRVELKSFDRRKARQD